MPDDTPCKDAPETFWELLDEAWVEAESRRAQAQSFSLVPSLVAQEDRLARLTLIILILNASRPLQAVVRSPH